MAVALVRDPLMPRDLDHDGHVAWWAIRTIGEWNGDLPYDSTGHHTTARLWLWDDTDWAELEAETEHVDEPFTEAQRDRIRSVLRDLERQDLREPTRWWER